MADEKDWKAKYFNSLQQLEDQESTWKQLEKLLRKAISRLAISAKGFRAPLDQQLQKIQQHSKDKDDAALSSDLEELSSLLAKMDITQPAPSTVETNENSNFHSYLLRLIDQLFLDTDSQSRIDDFKESIAELDTDQSLNSLAEILNELLQHEPVDETAIQHVLISLIEKISLTHGNSEQLNAIKEKLDFSFESGQWSAYLDDIISEIHSIIHGINHEKIEMESLIVDVTRQLNEISSVLTDDQSDTQVGRKDAQQLENLMNQSVENIQAQVNQENDISKLKSSIKDQINSIKTGVSL
ncbi:MAG: hypothetical protein KAU21_19505, partial [Gammaproteobacteria bacterium]|nr:hypothetical protein [Gammaproteobacteria bacterium]